MIYRKNTGVSKKKKKTLAKGKALITDALCVTRYTSKKEKKSHNARQRKQITETG